VLENVASPSPGDLVRFGLACLARIHSSYLAPGYLGLTKGCCQACRARYTPVHLLHLL